LIPVSSAVCPVAPDALPEIDGLARFDIFFALFHRAIAGRLLILGLGELDDSKGSPAQEDQGQYQRRSLPADPAFDFL